jgi:HPt (histidine-containing phosphotransfer) domain-containing protein
MDIQQQLRALVRQHHRTMRAQLDRIGQLLEEAAGNRAQCPALVGQAKSIAHQIKGSAGTIGFARISRAATNLDSSLKEILVREIAGPASLDRSLLFFSDLKRVLESTSPEQSSIYNADLSRL